MAPRSAAACLLGALLVAACCAGWAQAQTSQLQGSALSLRDEDCRGLVATGDHVSTSLTPEGILQVSGNASVTNPTAQEQTVAGMDVAVSRKNVRDSWVGPLRHALEDFPAGVLAPGASAGASFAMLLDTTQGYTFHWVAAAAKLPGGDVWCVAHEVPLPQA